MSGGYRFNSYDEKVGEVHMHAYDTCTPNHPTKHTDGTDRTTRKLPLCLILIELQVLLILLIFLTAMTAYHLAHQDESICSCGVSECAQVLGDGSNEQLMCNSTNVNEILRSVQEIHQQMMYTRNSTATITQLLQGNNSGIIELLQNIHDDQLTFYENNTDFLSSIFDHSERNLVKLMNIISTLAIHKETGITTAAVVDDILILVNELLKLQNASQLLNSVKPVSCKDILTALPDSPSGYYHVNSRDIYCNMDELCGSEGGWTRLAYLDMSDSTQSCPDGLNLYEAAGVRTCRRPYATSGSCASLKFPTNGISYTQVCGRAIGYQLGATDGLDAITSVSQVQHDNLDSYYVDGVSITRGSPRKHVWTFVTGLMENHYTVYNCPCNTPPGSYSQVQSFIGSNYFCESGNPKTYWNNFDFHSSDPLWDGKGCGSQEQKCCAADGLPWFHRQFENATTDFLELRVCSDQATSDEDTPISLYELYVQ